VPNNRQALPARLVLLAEDHFPLGTILGAPDADPALQSTPHPRAGLGVAAQRFYPFNAFRSLLGISGEVTAPTYAELYAGDWQHPKYGGCGR